MSRFNDTKGAAAAADPEAWPGVAALCMPGPHAAPAPHAWLLRALAWLAGLFCLASALGLLTPPAWAQPAAERRVALVIGNAGYLSAPPANPVNDAADLSAALPRLGCEVIEWRNRNADELQHDLIESQGRPGPGAAGLFYFAGLETPGLRLEGVFQQVRRDVERASNWRQSPTGVQAPIPVA
jgi:hypothetical protein